MLLSWYFSPDASLLMVGKIFRKLIPVGPPSVPFFAWCLVLDCHFWPNVHLSKRYDVPFSSKNNLPVPCLPMSCLQMSCLPCLLVFCLPVSTSWIWRTSDVLNVDGMRTSWIWRDFDALISTSWIWLLGEALLVAWHEAVEERSRGRMESWKWKYGALEAWCGFQGVLT